MLDEEIGSLLDDAGYGFNADTRTYSALVGAEEGETEHGSEFIADELRIPLEDLTRWEDEQMQGTET